MHWPFLQVLITTSITTSVVIIKLFNFDSQHLTRSLLRLYLSRNSITEIVKKATDIQKCGMKHSDIQEHFCSGSHWCYEKRRLLIYFGDTNAAHSGVLLNHGPIRQQLEAAKVAQMKAQCIHFSQAVLGALRWQLPQRKSFSSIPACYLKLNWNFCGISPAGQLWSHILKYLTL